MILDYMRAQPSTRTHKIRRTFHQICVTTSRIRIGHGRRVHNAERLSEKKNAPTKVVVTEQELDNNTVSTGNVDKLFQFISLAMGKHGLNNRKALGLLQFYKYDLELAVKELKAKTRLDMIVDVSWNLSGNHIVNNLNALPTSGIRRANEDDWDGIEETYDEYVTIDTEQLGDDMRMKKLSFCWADSTETEDILALYNMRHYQKESEALAELVVLKIAQKSLKSKLSIRKFDRPTVLKVVTNETTMLNSGIYDSMDNNASFDLPDKSIFGQDVAVYSENNKENYDEFAAEENFQNSYNHQMVNDQHVLSLELGGNRLDIRAGF